MIADEPEAYRIGWVPFLDCKIFLDSRPLIPRTETEYWVGQAILDIKNVRHRKSNIKIIDLFAGSGCIGVALLKHLPNAHVDFGELDERHLPTIAKNIHENPTAKERVSIFKTDVWSAVRGTYDYIFANPPYLAKSRMERIQESVLAFEPKEALFAEEDGFALIHKTVEGAQQHLNLGGAMYVEHEPEHAPLLEALAKSLGFHVETRKDQYGVVRYSRLRGS